MGEMRAMTVGGVMKKHHPDTKRSEVLALSHYLEEFPKEMPYKAILELIEREGTLIIGKRQVKPKELYEELWPFDLILKIKEMATRIGVFYGDQ